MDSYHTDIKPMDSHTRLTSKKEISAMKRRMIIALFTVLALSLGIVRESNAQASYTYQDIGTLAAGAVTTAYAINNQTEVAGQSAGHGFYWSAGSGMLDLGTLGGGGSLANGINNLGDVVGWALTADGSRHAFLWNASTRVMTDL